MDQWSPGSYLSCGKSLTTSNTLAGGCGTLENEQHTKKKRKKIVWRSNDLRGAFSYPLYLPRSSSACLSTVRPFWIDQFGRSVMAGREQFSRRREENLASCLFLFPPSRTLSILLTNPLLFFLSLSLFLYRHNPRYRDDHRWTAQLFFSPKFSTNGHATTLENIELLLPQRNSRSFSSRLYFFLSFFVL